MEPIDNAEYISGQHVTVPDFHRRDAGDMTENEEREFFRHLDECPECQAALAAWTRNGRPSDLNNDT